MKRILILVLFLLSLNACAHNWFTIDRFWEERSSEDGGWMYVYKDCVVYISKQKNRVTFASFNAKWKDGEYSFYAKARLTEEGDIAYQRMAIYKDRSGKETYYEGFKVPQDAFKDRCVKEMGHLPRGVIRLIREDFLDVFRYVGERDA